MVYLKRSVGYVQIALGIMLIFACFIGYDVLRARAADSYFWVDDTLSKVFYNAEVSPTSEQTITGLQLREYSLITTNFVIQSFVIIIFILAIMMILQGVANTKPENKDDVAPKELGKFMTILFLIICLLAAFYFLIFKSQNKAEDVSMMLLILAGLFIIFKVLKLKNPKKASPKPKA